MAIGQFWHSLLETSALELLSSHHGHPGPLDTSDIEFLNPGPIVSRTVHLPHATHATCTSACLFCIQPLTSFL